MNRNNVLILRKNTEWFQVIPYDVDGNEYFLEETDQVIFTVRKSNEASPSLTKILTVNDYSEDQLILKLTAEETNLPAGVYEFDISIKMENEQYTFIGPGKFIVEDTVTDWGGSYE